jgi:hypothetical protein
MTALRKTLAPAAALLVVLASRPAGADGGTAGDKAMAEALFRAAKDLQASGKLAEACPKYAESHRLDPKPGSILNLATCHELEGRTATAWADYDEAATFAARAHQADREKFARGKKDELAKKLSYVVFRFPEVNGLEVVLDGKALTTASAGTRVPLDPGEHELVARAPGKTVWSSKLEVEPGPADHTAVVPPLADEAGTTPAAAPPPSSPARDDARPAAGRSRDGSTQRTLGWIGVGAGAVAVSVGALFGVRTFSEKSTVDEHCVGSRCDDTGLSANSEAKNAATVSTIGFVAGGVLVVTGVVLLLTGENAKNAASAVSGARLMRGVW